MKVCVWKRKNNEKERERDKLGRVSMHRYRRARSVQKNKRKGEREEIGQKFIAEWKNEYERMYVRTYVSLDMSSIE